jgi:hypothetical protein
MLMELEVLLLKTLSTKFTTTLDLDEVEEMNVAVVPMMPGSRQCYQKVMQQGRERAAAARCCYSDRELLRICEFSHS